MATYASAPAVGIIDASNNLTLSWTPYPDGSGSFSQYAYWTVTVDSTPFTVLPVWFNPPTNTVLGTQMFTQTLSSGNHTLTMQGFNSSNAAVTNSWETNSAPVTRAFPSVLTQTDIAFSQSSILLGQTLTVTLSSLYSGADQWQVFWPDNTNTGWLSLSASVVAKSFSVPGTQNIVVQTRRDYSGTQYDPPVTLIRQVIVQIYVINQQAPGTSSSASGVAGDLGIGGQQGFEIVDASSPTAVPNPWEVIARAFVRDTVTNELKLLVATTRFGNASSLFGTMAADVFPIEGRPHSIELITPPYELTTTINTETVPVNIGTTVLPNLIVGKSITQALGGALTLTTKTGTGIAPFLWDATGLPNGVSISSSGVITGIPLELGVFSPTFAVQDSSIPFSIDEATLTLTVITDLLVQIATGQTDNSPTPQILAPLGTSLGVAQVGTPYNVQMQVGNTNPAAATPGGLAPYTWSIPAGALPVGLSINPSTGVISGSPCTYNSTTDYGITYTAVIEVTDAIGAKATQTYTMTLRAAALQFGPMDQTTIFGSQEFVLDVPVFGGQSPYTLVGFGPSVTDAQYFGTALLVDGRVEIPVGGTTAATPGGFPTTTAGGHQFTLQVQDSSEPASLSILNSINFQLAAEIANIRIVPANAGHEWGFGDIFATDLPISGNFTGYILGATVLQLTQATPSGATTVYTGTIGSTSYTGSYFTIVGFTNTTNNGAFQCTASTPTTLTLVNPNGVTETTVAKAVLDISPALGNGIALAIDNTSTIGSPPIVSPQVDVNGPPTSFNNSQARIVLSLTQGGISFGSVSREYTFSAHNDSANPGDIGLFTVYTRPYIANVDTVGLNSRKPYFNNAASVPPTISGSSYTARVQAGSSLPPGLSLDANTGLIYGPLVGVAANPSVIEYVDGGGTIHGTITIHWATYQNNFQTTNPGNTVTGSLGVDYTSSDGLVVFTAPSGVTLSNPQIVYPQSNGVAEFIPGMALSLNNTNPGNSALFTGTPTQAGYFDFWIQVQGGSNQISYVYQRIVIDYAPPLLILTPSPLADIAGTVPDPPAANDPLSLQFPPNGIVLQGFGGVPPYTWSSPQFPGGIGTGAVIGLTLSTNADSSGLISGYLTSYPGTSPTALFTTGSPLVLTLTDSRGALVNKNFTWTYDNTLRIVTTNVPTIIDNSAYSFAMYALGGLPPYQWQIASSPALPTGITFDAIFPSFSGNDRGGGADALAGQFSGTTAVFPYSQTIPITVRDSSTSQAGPDHAPYTAPFLIQTGPAVLSINSSNVNTINRGVPYQGTVTIENGTSNYAAPISWQIAPSTPILSGLIFQTDTSTQGVNAIFAGTYSGTPYQPYSLVNIVGNGSTATATSVDAIGFISGATVIITGNSVSAFNNTFTVASVAADYSSFTFSSGTNATGTGGVATVTADLYPVNLTATDSINQVAVAIVQLNTGTNLTITTNNLPNATVGGSYNQTLTATGGVSPYTWIVDPLTPGWTSNNSIPGTGLTLNGTTGAITGTASGVFNISVTFRVTDSLSPSPIPNFARATFTLVSQASGLTITTPAITPAISGKPYTFALLAAGDAHTPFTWSIASGALPAGITLNATTGVISGSSSAAGFSQPITWKVTDSIGAYVTKVLTFAVISGLALKSGIDYSDSLNTGIIGYSDLGQVTSINPRPNLSFYVVATGVQSTSTSTMSVSTNNANITGTIVSINAGVAQISLTGQGFDAGVAGNNTVSVSVTDSGTTVTGTFTWVMYNNGTFRFGTTLPTQLTTTPPPPPPPTPTYGATLVQSGTAHASTTGTIAFTYPSAIVAGDTLILSYISFHYNSGGGTNNNLTVTDNLGNQWQIAKYSVASSSEFTKYILYVSNAKAGTTTVTITEGLPSSSNSHMNAIFAEFSGVLTPVAVDGTGADEGTSDSGTVTTSFAHDLIISNIGLTAPPVPSGYTLIGTVTDVGNGSFTTTAAYIVTTTTGSFTPTWTGTDLTGVTAAFKLAQLN